MRVAFPFAILLCTLSAVGCCGIPSTVFLTPSSADVAFQAAGDKRCEPRASEATKWGPESTTEAAADREARKKARDSAAAGCAGKCREDGKEHDCVYVEGTSSILETEEPDEDAGVRTWRSRAKSSGTCDCRKEESEEEDGEGEEQ